MIVILFVTRLLLVVIFIWSGLAKLADRPGSRRAMLDFGIPARLAKPFALLVPSAELVVAGLLIPLSSAWCGALAALALLLVFTAAVGYHVSRGHKPSCHCFGQASADPIGPATIVRNLILIGLTAPTVLYGRSDAGISITTWLTTGTPVQLAQLGLTAIAVVLLALGCRILIQLRQPGRAPASTAAPGFALPSLAGETVTLDNLLANGRPVLLIFSDPACGSCDALKPDIARWHREYTGRLTIAVISTGTPEANRPVGQVPVLLEQEREVSAAFEVHGTPCAVVVQPDRTIMSSPTYGAEQIEKLAVHAAIPLPVAPVHDHRPVPIGDTAPAFTLPDLDGRPTSLADFHGRQTLLLFWDPGCGFCADMLTTLQEWDSAPHDLALVVISTGDVAQNRAMGLHSPVLLDNATTVGPAFGVSGTPMAILIDPAGRVASEVAAGAASVLALGSGTQVSDVDILDGRRRELPLIHP